MDERLRDLEEAARRDPSDTRAGLAWARALGRAGRELERAAALERLARAGVAEAAVRLDPGPPPGLRAAPAEQAVEVLPRTAAWPVARVGTRGVLVALDDPGTTRLALHEGDRPEPRWERPGRDLAAAAGEDALHLSATELCWLDGATGTVRAAAPLEAAEGHALAATGGVAVVGGARVRAYDASSPERLGRLRWERPGPPLWGAVPGAVLLWDSSPQDEDPRWSARRVDVRDPADGRRLWTLERPGALLAADARGVLVAEDEVPGALSERPPGEAEPRWRIPDPTARRWRAALTPERALLWSYDRAEHAHLIRALDRADGATAWERTRRGRLATLAAARDVLYLLAWPERPGQPPRLEALDLAGGEPLFGRDLPLDRPPATWWQAHLAPLPGALLVLVQDQGSVTRLWLGG